MSTRWLKRILAAVATTFGLAEQKEFFRKRMIVFDMLGKFE